MNEYNLKKILEDILKKMDEQEESHEYTEELKELYEFVEELNSKKELIIECPEIEDVIRNYVVEWVVWGIAMRREDIETRVSLLYSSFCFQISNMILGICKLVKEGLDYPAMCLIRVLLEMIMIFLAILIDDNYKEKYFETADVTKEYSIWKKELRIGKTEEIVWKYASSEDEETAKYCEECKNLYEELYKDFSKFDHNSYANMIVMQFALTDDERLNLNVNGNKVSAIERVLKQVLMIVFPLEALFSKVIFEKYAVEYKIPEDEFGQKMWSYGKMLHIMVSDLAQKYLEDTQKKTV